MNICEYGCGQEAKYQLKNGRWCCSKMCNSCPEMRKKYKNEILKTCPICNKQFRINCYKQHVNVCGIPRKTIFDKIKIHSELLETGQYKCKECGKIVKSSNSFTQHFQIIHLKTKRLQFDFQKIWNTGLTKENDLRVKKSADTLKSHYADGTIKPTIIHHSQETKDRLSKIMTEKNYGERKNKRFFHGRYKDYWCDSSWELIFVIYCLEHDIKFKRNTDKFDYIFNGSRKYVPDFIINDIYYEIKGFISDQDKAKLKYFPCKIKLLHGRNPKFQEMKKYVEEKYGKKFWYLYNSK